MPAQELRALVHKGVTHNVAALITCSITKVESLFFLLLYINAAPRLRKSIGMLLMLCRLPGFPSLVKVLWDISLTVSPDIMRLIKSRRLRWAGHVAQIEENRSTFEMLTS